MILSFVILAVYIAANIYVFVRLLRLLGRLLPQRKGVRIVCKALFAFVFWLSSVAIFVSMIFRDADIPQWLLGCMYSVGSVWLVFLLYMVLALLVTDILRLFCKGSFLKNYGTPAAFFFVVFLLIYGFINYKHPKVEQLAIDLREGREVELSGRTNKARIVAVSDVHLGWATGKKALKRYVEQINSLNPDIILIGGDLLDNSIVPLVQQRMDEELGMLNAPMGVYMVPGNHEYISGMHRGGVGGIGGAGVGDDVVAFLEKTPIVLLRDSVVALPGGLIIVGCDDRRMFQYEELLDGIEKEGPVILVEHQPRNIALKDSLGVDIQFYGHTHRGQVWPVSLLVDRMYEQSHGYRKWNNSHVIVSSGLSLWGPPFRIGTDSDLWVLDLLW